MPLLAHDWVQLIGYLASTAVFTTFCTSTMLPLRVIALVSNTLFVVYAYLALIYPVLILHLLLFPVNVWRLTQVLRLVLAKPADDGGSFDFGALRPYMTAQHYRARDAIFHKGDTAEELFYIESGTVAIEDFSVGLGPGEVFGEIGTLLHDRQRTATAIAATDCAVWSLTEKRARELYFQNPRFSLRMIELSVARLVDDLRGYERRLV
jgi:CRP/FNR family cyclic AMP-dependent transcriptional regulator